jgi:hypothetical protein
MACFSDSTTSNASCFVGALLSGIAVMFVKIASYTTPS